MGKLDVTGDLLLQRITVDWQPLDPIIDGLIPTVAPGVALRRYQARVRQRVDRGDVQNVRTITERQKQETGARSIIGDRIQSQKGAGRLEIMTQDGVRYVRLIAEGSHSCPTCNRPFPLATPNRTPHPSSQPKPRPSKVVYPKFPQWSRGLEESSSG